MPCSRSPTAFAGRQLSMTVTVSNPTAANLPYGFGIHPYFRLPFSPGGDPAQTQVILPASKYWVLKDFLPTGEIRPVDSRLDFRTGKPRNGLELDDVLTGLQYHDRRGLARLVDLEKKAEFRLTFDDGIRELVVYTPPQKPDVLAVEPYTQTTDAINLQSQGKDAGLRLLGPRPPGHVLPHDGNPGLTTPAALHILLPGPDVEQITPATSSNLLENWQRACSPFRYVGAGSGHSLPRRASSYREGSVPASARFAGACSLPRCNRSSHRAHQSRGLYDNRY